jgi:hypothetical protein
MHYILQRHLQFSSRISHFSSRIFHFPDLNSIFFTNFDRALRGVRVEVQGITRRKGGTRRHFSGNALDLRPYPTLKLFVIGTKGIHKVTIKMWAWYQFYQFSPVHASIVPGFGGLGNSSVPPLTLCSICQLPLPKNSEHPSVFPFSLLMLALFLSVLLHLLNTLPSAFLYKS